VRAEAGELPRLFCVISALLQERVPLREWRAIVNRYLELVKAGLAPGEIVEELRGLPAVRSALPGNAEDVLLVRVPASVLDAVSTASVRQGSTGALVFGPEALHETLADLRRALGGRSLPKAPVFVVDDPSMRPFVRLLLHYEFPDLHVLSRREVLAPEAIVDLESLEEKE